jgi:hypothetical protein
MKFPIAAAFMQILFLAGCATDHAEPVLKPVEYKIAVAVSCVPKDFPGRPVYADTKEALAKAHVLGADAFDKLITAGWVVRDARLAALEAQIDACR